jgi:hypothetical protein
VYVFVCVFIYMREREKDSKFKLNIKDKPVNLIRPHFCIWGLNFYKYVHLRTFQKLYVTPGGILP